jgi:UDP-GlcNAc3NAcA epimerase
LKIVTVVGARPQFVKAAVVSRAIADHPDLREILLHTGQHFDREMSDIFFEEMGIPEPHYNLGVNSSSHGEMTGRMLEGIERVLLVETPDVVMVYGDTNSTLAGALAAKKLTMKVVHVEAGLRSRNMRMPEEINRILTDRISDLLCCPTDRAVRNLLDEGFGGFPCRVVKTGDVMFDAALHFMEVASTRSTILSDLDLAAGKFILCTVHRAENTDDPERLSSILQAFNVLSRETRVVFPIHPRTEKIIHGNGFPLAFRTIRPLGYLDMIRLLQNAEVVLTDSGGLQKEAFFFRRPCVTLRDETEWVELVEGGFNCLAGAERDRIVETYRRMRATTPDFDADLYGRGTAARKVVESIASLT